MNKIRPSPEYIKFCNSNMLTVRTAIENKNGSSICTSEDVIKELSRQWKAMQINETPDSLLRLKYRCHRSYHGIDLNLLKSCLQKPIRRNNVKLAVWVSVEWALFVLGAVDTNTTKLAKGIITNLRNRLIICYLEDIGIANISLWYTISPMLQLVKYGTPIQTLVDTVSKIANLMATSPGCRTASYCNSLFKIIMNHELLKKVRPYLKSFPSVARDLKYLEKHKDETGGMTHIECFNKAIIEKSPTATVFARWIMNPKISEGKYAKTKYGKNQILFHLLESTPLNTNPKIQSDPDFKTEFIKGTKIIKGSILGLSYTWFNAIHNNESWLAIIIPILSLIFPVNKYESNIDIVSTIDIDEHKNTYFDQDSIPLYCVDMHTVRGRREFGLSKTNLAGVTHWVNEGAYIEDEFRHNGYKEREAFYRFTKYLSVGKCNLQYLEWAEIESDSNSDSDTEIESDSDSDSDTEIESDSDTEIESDSDTEIESDSDSDTEIVPDSETGLFDDMVRVQISTGRAKTDTFMATLLTNCAVFKKGTSVFVKGPFKTNAVVLELIEYLDSYKEAFGLPRIKFQIMNDIKVSPTFGNETNTQELYRSNYRYNVKPETGSFVIFESLLNVSDDGEYKKIRYGDLKKHKSKAWKDANVFILDQEITGQLDWKRDLQNDTIRISYVLAMCFRYLFGILDHANRNFIVKGDKVYSVDEENVSFLTSIKFGSKTPHAKKCELIRDKWTSEFDTNIKTSLKNWKKSISPTDDCNKRLNILINNPICFFE